MRQFNISGLMRFGLSIFLAWAAASPIGVAATRPGMMPVSTSSRTGIIVPLYIYPGADWDRLVQVKNNNLRVPIVAVINPNNGPGNNRDMNYVTGIQNLHAAGIIVLGYVYTSYASRSREAVQTDINAYENWYAPDGIFFDEMSNLAGNENYYFNLTAYAKSLGLGFTMGNPAADTLPSYLGSMDSLVINENPGLPNPPSLGGWHTTYAKQNFAMIVYGVGALDPSFVNSASDYVGYMYITNDVPPNPYDALPTYFEQLVSALNNRPPVANNAFTVKVNTTLNVAAPGVLGHDSDLDGDALTAMLVNGPANGALTLNADGSFSYAPKAGFTGIDSFTYQARDSYGGQSGIATVTIQVVLP